VRDEVKGVIALAVGDVGVGAVCDEKLDDIDVPVTRRPVKWSRHKISTLGVDFC
jgi:hypothetical protein